MTQHNVLIIPWKGRVSVEHINVEDQTLVERLVLGHRPTERDSVARAPFRGHGLELAYNENAMFSHPNNVNHKAMNLWMHLSGMDADDFLVPIVGDHVALGITPWGESDDVPQWLIDLVSP